MKFLKKILRIGGAGKLTFCSVFLFLVIGFFKKKCFLCFINEKTKGSYEVAFFLHYGWFLQNLEKGFIPTNMHTTVLLSNLQNAFKNV